MLMICLNRLLKENQKIFDIEKIKQDRNKEVRYSKKSDFTEKKAEEFLKGNYPFDKSIVKYPKLLNPIFF